MTWCLVESTGTSLPLPYVFRILLEAFMIATDLLLNYPLVRGWFA
jgi:hypothetical protein